ncbi:hypothetical protein AB0E88_20815 [Streptomyces sp. NPDC028635]|uniref:hypothetical protein n=1 Tax=Streptomyces sp. NPDC028635 TaxID=3154800 RepID=UPI0033CE1415
MADEQYRWLDRETAERLLRGEPLDAVPADAREEAERLARALGELSAVPEKTGTGLAGEDAALAAFRVARTAHAGGAHASDNGVVRIGAGRPAGRRSRWGRPLRLALCAVVAAGTVGGVAVAAGTGVLPAFGGAEPGPRVSVSADATPERPPGPSSPDGTGTASTGGTAGSGTGRDGDREAAGDPDSAGGRGADALRRRITEACQDLRGGHDLDGDRRRALETAAGGAPRVGAYCKNVLAAPAAGAGQDGTNRSQGGGVRGATGAGKDTSGKGGGKGGGKGAGNGGGNAASGGTGKAGEGGKGTGGQKGGQNGGQGGGQGGDQRGGAGGGNGGGKGGGKGGDDDGHGRSGGHGHGHGPPGGHGHGHGGSKGSGGPKGSAGSKGSGVPKDSGASKGSGGSGAGHHPAPHGRGSQVTTPAHTL